MTRSEMFNEARKNAIIGLTYAYMDNDGRVVFPTGKDATDAIADILLFAAKLESIGIEFEEEAYAK